MKPSDIAKVAEALSKARPGAYPMGGPATDDGWKMWHTCCFTMTVAIAECTRDFLPSVFEAMCNEERK